MKVKLDVSPDSDIKVETDDSGNVVSVMFEPFFSRRTGQAVLAYGAAINDKGVTLDRFSLSVSAATGKVSKAGRADPVRAAADEIEGPADTKAEKPNEGAE